MKKLSFLIFMLVIFNIANAQYAYPRPNDTGVYTTESATGGDKMAIATDKEKNSFTVEYSFIDPFNKAVLVVFDISGKVIVQKEINYSIDQIIIPTGNWPGGLYTCTLFADGQTIMTKQITITN